MARVGSVGGGSRGRRALLLLSAVLLVALVVAKPTESAGVVHGFLNSITTFVRAL